MGNCIKEYFQKYQVLLKSLNFQTQFQVPIIWNVGKTTKLCHNDYQDEYNQQSQNDFNLGTSTGAKKMAENRRNKYPIVVLGVFGYLKYTRPKVGPDTLVKPSRTKTEFYHTELKIKALKWWC